LLDTEIYREIVREYQRSCTEVIAKYDGNVAQLLGDGLLVYFGYPVAHEDDAQRSVRSGLGIIEGIEKLNIDLERNKGVKLAVRLGIHTGLVVVGEMGSSGRQEQLALGETPNVAARIQGIAEPNTVVISADTYRLVEGYFDCQMSGEYSLKGLAQPVTAYRVIQESEALNHLDVTAARGLTPLVGRESELALLLDRWEQAKSAQGQVVIVSGEAGIGKSRLIRTLRERASTEPHNRLECRCSLYFQNTTLYPLLDLLERTLGFDRQDTPETKLQKLETALGQYRLDIETTIPLLAFPLSIPLPEDRYPPLNLTPQRRKQRGLETFMAMMLEMAERQPVLFILEDLHWVDATTIEFLDLLMKQAPTASILAVLTCRPEFTPPWGLKSHLTPIALNRLPRRQIATLIERVTEGKRLPDEVIRHLIEKTDGVPLYVEEMTKALLESGHLKENDAGYELTQPLDTISIPATLQDSLMARLDNLDTAKGVAQLGAVIGRQFSYDLLQAVSPLDGTSLQLELDKLIDAELIYQRDVFPNLTYIFKHAFIQDTAYESLLRSTRQGYHRRIAEVIEGQFPEIAETQPELLAYHYTVAGMNEQAIVYWRCAGEHAHCQSAYMEALAHLCQGVELLIRFPETHERIQHELDLQVTLASAYHAIYGQTAPEVEQCYLRICELAEQLDDDHCLFYAYLGLYRCYGGRGQMQEHSASLDALFQVAQRTQTSQLLVEAHMARGTHMMDSGQLILGHDYLKQASAHYNPQDHQFYIAHSSIDPGVNSLSRYSWVLWFLGYPDQALTYSQHSVDLARNLGHFHSLAMVCDLTAILHILRGDNQASQEQVETAMALATQHDLYQWQQMAAILQEYYLAYQENYGEHLAKFKQAITAYRQRGLYLQWFVALLGEVYGQYGQYDRGLESLVEAFYILNRGGFYCWESELHRIRGILLQYKSKVYHTEAESCFRQAISIAQNQSAKSWELRAATSLTKLWQSQGKRQEAYDLLAPVYGWFTEGFDTADLIDAKTLLDELSSTV
jgi:class 3 adenylate cyclase/predicted ATPase